MAKFDPKALQDIVASLFDGNPPGLTDELIAERRREASKEQREAAKEQLRDR